MPEPWLCQAFEHCGSGSPIICALCAVVSAESRREMQQLAEQLQLAASGSTLQGQMEVDSVLIIGLFCVILL